MKHYARVKAWRRKRGGWRADGCTLDQVSEARGLFGREWGQGIKGGQLERERESVEGRGRRRCACAVEETRVVETGVP